MNKVYVAKCRYGSMTLTQVEVAKDMPKTVLAGKSKNLVGNWTVWPGQRLRKDEVFNDGYDALEWLVMEADKYIHYRQKEIDRLKAEADKLRRLLPDSDDIDDLTEWQLLE